MYLLVHPYVPTYLLCLGIKVAIVLSMKENYIIMIYFARSMFVWFLLITLLYYTLRGYVNPINNKSKKNLIKVTQESIVILV